MEQPMSYPPLVVTRKTGGERFHCDRTDLGFDLLSFWQWFASDLVSNATRECVAEYLVARALGISTDGIRHEWDPFDLEVPRGPKIEVKSAAYVQTWFQEELSTILFHVGRTRGWDPQTNKLESEPKRQADVYVFALLSHTEKPNIDPMDVGQWEFYVVPTKTLNERTRSQHSITLKSLKELESGPVRFTELRDALNRAWPYRTSSATASSL
jgi:hypothetical protein